MKNLIQKILTPKKNKACSCQKTRSLHFESLEERQLLVVTAAEISQLCEQYPFSLMPTDWTTCNVIEITASELSETNLRQAVNTASATAGQNIIVVRTTETQNTIKLTGTELAINVDYGMKNRAVIIVSLGPKPLTIDGNQQSRIFRIEGDGTRVFDDLYCVVNFVGISFTNGYCSQDGGGAILATDSQLTLNGCTFINNVSAGNSGGAIHGKGEQGQGQHLWVYNCTFQNNTAGLDGGAVSLVDTNDSSSLGISNTDFIENQSGRDGGGVYVKGVSGLKVGSVIGKVNFIGNTALDGNGGGLWVEADQNVSVRLEHVTFEGNKANRGGGIGVKIGNSITASNLVFRDNVAQQYGGAMYFDGASGRVSNVTAQNNTPDVIYTRNSPNLRFENMSFPMNLRSTSRTSDSVTLVWDAATDATGYVFQYKKATDTNWTTATVASGALTATVSGLSTGTEYNFRVQATNTGGVSDWATTIVTTEIIDDKPPAVPTDFQSTAQTTNSVTLTWNAATGATGYLLEYKKASDIDWTEFPVADGALTVTMTGLSADTNYNFRIRATNDNGSSDWAIANATTLMQPPQVPVNFRSTTRQTNSVTLAWDAAERATGYVLQYKRASDANWTTTTAPTGTSATITGLSSGTTYNFRIQATNNGGTSDWATVNAMTLMTTPQNFRSTAKTANSVTLAWNAVTGATGYELQYKEAGDLYWTTTSAQYGTMAIISDLTADTDYNFRIRAANADNVTSWTTINVTTNTIKLDIPVLTNVYATRYDSITVAWNAVPNASNYVVQYATNAEFSEGVGTMTVPVTFPSAVIGKLAENTTYYVRVMALGTGAYSDSVYSMIRSAKTPTIPLGDITMPQDDTPHEWTVRKSQTDINKLEIADLKNGNVVDSFSLDTLDHLVINSSGTANDSLTIDFSHGSFTLANGIQFNGHEETFDTLYFVGTNGNDAIFFSETEKRFNDLAVVTQYVEIFSFDAGAGINEAFVIGTESNNMFNVSDNFLGMIGGGYCLEFSNFNTIDAIAAGRNDKTFVYAENDSLIVMNDLFVELRGQDRLYRVWHSEQVTAINIDDTNNAILHTGSRCYDVFTLTQNYATATNAVGSYFHEFIGFENIILPFAALPVSQPTALETAMQPATMETPIASKPEPTFAADDDWNENLFAFLADEQLRLHHKKEAYYETDDWLVDFAKLALWELRK